MLFRSVLVAVPVAAAIGVLVRFSLDVYLASSVYRGATTKAELANGQHDDARREVTG